MPMIQTFKLLVAILTVFIAVDLKAQASPAEVIHFLADTISTTKENKLLEIGTEAKFVSYYTFYCKCAPPYFSYPTFMYRNDRVKPKFSDTKPEANYVSWKQLSDLLAKYGNHFPEHFKLVMVEKLPAGNYKIIEDLRYVRQKNEKNQ